MMWAFAVIVRRVRWLVLAVAGAMMTGGAVAAEFCSVAPMIESYKAGLARYQDNNFAAARALWQPLAALGFPPAQGQMAGLYARGLGGVAADLAEAGKWAVLAARTGDGASTRLVDQISKALGEAAFRNVIAAADGWRPELPSCLRLGEARWERLDAHRVKVGASVVQVDTRFPDKTAAAIIARFRYVVGEAQRLSPTATLYLSSVKAYHIIPGDKYDRYVGWKVGKQGAELEITAGNMLDKSPAFLAMAIVQEASRELYRQIPGATLNDPYLRTYKGKRIVGSVYPDVENRPFFEAVLLALETAERLPPDVRRHVEIIDEIRYNPQSEHMAKGGLLDPGIGYYDRRLSAEGRRIIFIRRDMKWSFAADVLLTIVHEGTHATQHRTAERLARELPAKQAALRALEKDGAAKAKEADSLRRDIAAAEEYLRLWSRQGGTEEERRASLKRIECEATIQEIKTAQALDYEPSVITKSPYFQFCDDVQKMMVEWKDRRLREGLKQSNTPTKGR